MDVPDLIELERRLDKVEQQLRQESRSEPRTMAFHPVWPLLMGLAAVVLGHFSAGFPRHYYPYLFSFLLLLLLYHRADLRLEAGAWKWPLAFVNFLLLCLLFQTFLLLAVLAGALFRFEPFTFLSALALMLVSVPFYLRLNWDWVIPFIVAASVSLYLQARTSST